MTTPRFFKIKPAGASQSIAINADEIRAVTSLGGDVFLLWLRQPLNVPEKLQERFAQLAGLHLETELMHVTSSDLQQLLSP